MRPLLLALLLATPVLAGCVKGPETPAADVDVGLLAELPFVGTYAVVDPEVGGTAEPSLGVTPDGVLFTNGRGGQGGFAYRSMDGGLTWENMGRPVAPMPNFDPDLAVDADGNVWFDALWIGCTAVAVSRDLGETWSHNPAACNAPVADRQYVIPTTGGEAYLYSHQLPTFWQMAAKTTDYGRTWIPTGPIEMPDHHLFVNGGSGWGGGGFWNNATGSVFLTWTWREGGVMDPAWNPGFAVTRDGGKSWELGTAKSMGGEGLGLGLVVGAADAAGNAYLAWGEDHGGEVHVYLAASADDGRTWNEPVRVDAGNGSKVFPAIAAGAPGKVAIAYYEADEGKSPSDVEGHWNVTLAWTGDAFAQNVTFRHERLSDHPVKKGPICIDGTTCEGGREFADYFQIKRLPDGRVGAMFNSLLEPGVEKKLVQVYAATREPIVG